MTKFGETHNYVGSDFVKCIESNMDRLVDGVVCNSNRPPDPVCVLYARQKSECVSMDLDNAWWNSRRLYSADLLDENNSVARHDPRKLARLLEQIFTGAV